MRRFRVFVVLDSLSVLLLSLLLVADKDKLGNLNLGILCTWWWAATGVNVRWCVDIFHCRAVGEARRLNANDDENELQGSNIDADPTQMKAIVVRDFLFATILLFSK